MKRFLLQTCLQCCRVVIIIDGGQEDDDKAACNGISDLSEKECTTRSDLCSQRCDAVSTLSKTVGSSRYFPKAHASYARRSMTNSCRKFLEPFVEPVPRKVEHISAAKKDDSARQSRNHIQAANTKCRGTINKRHTT